MKYIVHMIRIFVSALFIVVLLVCLHIYYPNGIVFSLYVYVNM